MSEPPLTGLELATLRRRLRLTQAELADYLQVHVRTVSRWERLGNIPAWVPRILEQKGN